MTYCVGMSLRSGLVFLSDSRTAAGVDNISTFRKMTVWEKPGERVIALMTAGNLAVAQSVVTLLNEGVPGGCGQGWRRARNHERGALDDGRGASRGKGRA